MKYQVYGKSSNLRLLPLPKERSPCLGSSIRWKRTPPWEEVSHTELVISIFSFTIGDAHFLKVRQDLQIISRLVFFHLNQPYIRNTHLTTMRTRFFAMMFLISSNIFFKSNDLEIQPWCSPLWWLLGLPPQLADSWDEQNRLKKFLSKFCSQLQNPEK